MRIVDITCVNVVVCIATATAIELCPALFALRLIVNVCVSKHIFHFLVKCAVIEIAHFELGDTNELMTWVNIAVRSNRNILVSASTAPKSLYRTRTLIEVYHKMEEVYELALVPYLLYLLRKYLILLEDPRQNVSR